MVHTSSSNLGKKQEFRTFFSRILQLCLMPVRPNWWKARWHQASMIVFLGLLIRGGELRGNRILFWWLERSPTFRLCTIMSLKEETKSSFMLRMPIRALLKPWIGNVIQQAIYLYQLQINERTEKYQNTVLQSSECQVPLPSRLDKNCFTLAAMDNFDNADKNSLSISKNASSRFSTAITLFQVQPDKHIQKPPKRLLN